MFWESPLELNKAYQMDCLEGMKLIPDRTIDMILCDLPYGTTQNKWDSVIPFDLLWNQYKRIIKENGAIVLTAQTPFDKALGMSNPKMLRYEWIWKKNNSTGFLNAKKAPLKIHENILVFYKKAPTYNPQGVVKKKKPILNRKSKNGNGNGSNYGKSDKDTLQEYENYPKDVLEFSRDTVDKFHPTQKPVALFEYLVKTYTNEGEIVLDNCLGSGTTAVACENTNRNWIGFETEKEYIKVINERLERNRRRLKDEQEKAD